MPRKLAIILVLLPGLTWAQLPLSIEELLVDQDVLKLETSLSYATAAQTVQRFDLISFGGKGAGAREIPRIAQRNTEASQLVTGLRYGVSPKLELNLRARYSYFSSKEPPVDGSASVFNDSGNLQSLTLGTSWLASSENETPALLLSVSIDAVEKSSVGEAEAIYGKTGRLGITAYKSLDPVVLSVSAGYELRSERGFFGSDLNPGDEFFVLPQLNFAVNHKVTLIGGVGLHLREGDSIDGRKVSARTSSTQVLLGLGFAPDRSSTIFFQTRFTTGGDRSSNISLDWLYQF